MYLDDLYTDILLRTCVHEQRAYGLQSIGVANKNIIFVTLVDIATRIARPVFHRFQQIDCTYESLRCLESHLVDVAIWRSFVMMMTDKTDYFTPCASMRGN